jgi:hypothetical protein
VLVICSKWVLLQVGDELRSPVFRYRSHLLLRLLFNMEHLN